MVHRSKKRSPFRTSFGRPLKRTSKVSGHKSWWSKRKRDRCTSRNIIPMGQKMSGGLQLWTTVKRPFLAAFVASQRVAIKE